jgi:phage terminase Nu1 subunit (DNA packaging protein)
MTDFDEDSQIVRSADTKRQFAERFSVSPRTVSTWLSRGLPFLKLSERAVRVPVAEGTEWVRTNFLTYRRPRAKTGEEKDVA